MLQTKKIVFGLIDLLFLILSFNIVTPLIYRILPNNYQRTKVILEYLDSVINDQNDSIAIFGSSIAMTGMNADFMQKYFDNKYEVLNFSSVGQPIQESALYYTKLPENTKVVIQCIGLLSLISEPTIPKPAAIAFAMYNYKLDKAIEYLLPLQSYSMLNESRLLINYKARTFVKAGLSTLIVNILYDDAAGNSGERFSLKYPYIYPSNRSNTYEMHIGLINQTYNLSNYKINADCSDIIVNSSDYFSSRGIPFVLVIMPISPDITSASKSEIEYALNTVKESFANIPIVDCYSLLEPNEFYDAIHPNRTGGEKLSREVSQYVSEILAGAHLAAE
ncbi:hypothetical protein FACS1894109_01140 [Spirochaetia bacterium]|nr:hypothetical protein FACS1894109_01140 [Spirochaetia bacterium]